MFGLPLEIITMLFSTILGGVMKFIGQGQANKVEMRRLELDLLQQKEQGLQNAREMDDPFAKWTRRFIVVAVLGMAIFALIAPTILQIPTSIPHEVVVDGWFTTETYTEWVKLEGLVIPDYLRYSILNIIAFYFGTSAVSSK